MKNNSLTFIATVLISINSFAQNNWTKDDRTNVYNECLSNITKYGITNEQKQSVCLCYVNKIAKDYDKQSYQSLMDIEIKNLRESTLTLCAKSLSIELTEKKEEVKTELQKNENAELSVTKENIIGHWKDENSEFWLFETGDYKMQYNDGKTAKGTWKVDNNELDLYKDRLLGTSVKLFKILIFTKNKFVYKSLTNRSDTFTATRVN